MDEVGIKKPAAAFTIDMTSGEKLSVDGDLLTIENGKLSIFDGDETVLVLPAYIWSGVQTAAYSYGSN